MPDRDVSIRIRIDTSELKKLKEVPSLLSNLGAHARRMSSIWTTEMQKSIASLVKSGKITKEQGEKILKSIDTSYRGILTLYDRLGISSREYTEQISHDNSRLAQYARKFAKEWGVSLEDARSFMKGIGLTSKQTSQDILVDLKKGEQYAQDFARNWGVSLDDARAYIERLGLQTKRFERVVSHDIDIVAKRARVFAKEWGVSFREAYNYMQRLGVGTQKTSKSLAYNLTFIAWHFRYLGNIFKQISGKWQRFTEDWIQNAADIEEATFGIRVASNLFGRDSERATRLVKDLVNTGLIKYKDAAEAVRNLLLTGIGMPELEKTMWGLLNLSTIFTVAGKDLGDSINKVSAAVLRGTALMQSDLLTRTLLKDMTNEQRKALERNWSAMSRLERAQALFNQVMKMSVRTGELWRGEAGLMAGQIYKLQTNIQLTKAALGKALRPVLDLVADLMSEVRKIVEVLSSRFAGLVSVITILGIALTSTFASFSFGMGIVLSFIKILKGLKNELGALNGIFAILRLQNWQIFLVLTAVGAAITGVTYAILKATGRLDKYKKKWKESQNALKEVRNELEALGGTQEAINDLMGETIGISEKERIEHERRTADILEDLERERAKGLWANQMRIKELEKQLRREQEDWELLQKEKAKLEEKDKITKKKKSRWELLTQAEKLKEILEQTKQHFKQLDEIYTPWYTKIGEKIAGLSPAWQAALAGIATYIASIGIPALNKLSKKIGSLGSIAKTAFAKIGIAFESLKKTLSAPISITILVSSAVMAITAVLKHFKLVKSAIEDQKTAIQEASDFWDEYMRKQKELLKQGRITKKEFEEAYRISQDALRAIKETLITPEEKGLWKTIKRIPSAWKETLGFQFGGIVPGMRNQPVPIIAHGGERIIPAGEVATSGNITININNPVVRAESDIQRIAQAVSFVLGQRQRFSRLGAL